MDTEEDTRLVVAPPANFSCRKCAAVLAKVWPNALHFGEATVEDRAMVWCVKCRTKNLWRPIEVKRSWRPRR